MSCNNFLSQLSSVYQPIVDVTLASPIYHAYGVLVLFLYSMTPSFLFIPNEAFYIPLLDAGVVQPLAIVFIIGIGGTIGDSLIYFGSKHGFKFFTKDARKADVKVDKLLKHFHKHKWLIFLITPSIPAFGDLPLVYAGVKKVHYMSFIHYLIGGNFIRAIWGIAATLGVFEVFGQLCGF